VYYEEHHDVKEAIEREKRIKRMATGMEDESDRGYESPVARFECPSAIVTWIPACAGMTKKERCTRVGITERNIDDGWE